MSVPAHRLKLAGFLAELIEAHHGSFTSMLDLGSGKLYPVWKKRWDGLYEGLDLDTDLKADYYMDACDLSRFESDSRDVVTAWSTIEHVRHPYDMLCEMKRVSKGTCLFTTDYNQHDKDGDPTHLYSWTPKTLGQLVEMVHGDCNVYNAKGLLIGVMYRCSTSEN